MFISARVPYSDSRECAQYLKIKALNFFIIKFLSLICVTLMQNSQQKLVLIYTSKTKADYLFVILHFLYFTILSAHSIFH